MKTCIRCHAEKALDDFYSHSGMRDGHLNKCKDCCKTAARENGRTERVRTRQRERAEKQRRASGVRLKVEVGRRQTNSHGYILVYVGHEHPMATKRGLVYEHRLVMADALGRMLERREIVHHINGVRTDNRLENLELYASHGDHMQGHKLHRKVV